MGFDKNFYKIYLITLTIFLSISSFFIYHKFFNSKQTIVSPLPDFLTAFANDQASTLNLWSPIFEMFNPVSPIPIPVITAKSALIYDLKDQKVLFSKNPRERLPMASLTKIMTAIVAIESLKKDDQYIVAGGDLVGENSMGLSLGEKLSLEELLYGLILTSANDAAETIAGNFPKGRAQFIIAMNNKTKALGLSETHFTNPTGLEGDGDQYTTAYDLLVMTNYALKLPLFERVVRTVNYGIPYSEDHKEFYLENETNLLTSYPGVVGVKDGYTPEAGLCLATYLNYKGHKIIGILLGSDNRRQEMKDLLDYSLKLQGITPPQHK